MDWRNDESDHSSVENFTWDERSLLTKIKSDASLSGAIGCNVCSQGVQANFGNCKESRSFTSALERLELEAEIEARNEIPLRRTSDAQTEPPDDTEQELYGLNTRDIPPCRLLQHTDILTFQGVRYPPEDIARYWKKDARMWLWKSVRLMRSKKKPVTSNDMCAVNNENEEKE
ncbi:hypothetical protein WN55_08117 [Dufourea novaeangliae]|uniref:Uncharacterized protein n=1 Tax=Dufourea novaeangliae TaxID=178035 RepID=A0A154P4U9_DUFNO|nr:hypothetical protein WN55_08117 [Dufourea novaeangliae]